MGACLEELVDDRCPPLGREARAGERHPEIVVAFDDPREAEQLVFDVVQPAFGLRDLEQAVRVRLDALAHVGCSTSAVVGRPFLGAWAFSFASSVFRAPAPAGAVPAPRGCWGRGSPRARPFSRAAGGPHFPWAGKGPRREGVPRLFSFFAG